MPHRIPHAVSTELVMLLLAEFRIEAQALLRFLFWPAGTPGSTDSRARARSGRTAPAFFSGAWLNAKRKFAPVRLPPPPPAAFQPMPVPAAGAKSAGTGADSIATAAAARGAVVAATC